LPAFCTTAIFKMDTDRAYLTAFFKQTIALADDVSDEIAQHFLRETFKKNDFLLKQGQI
jgi:hypothetical protein